MFTLQEQQQLGHASLDPQSRTTLGAVLGNRATILAKAAQAGAQTAGSATGGQDIYPLISPGLLSRTTIDLKVVATTTLFTPPTGASAVVITAMYVECAVGVLITVVPQVSLGQAVVTNIYPNTALTGLNAALLTYGFQTNGLISSSTAAVRFNVSVGATATSMIGQVDLIGFVF